jgi:hypothetical protein
MPTMIVDSTRATARSYTRGDQLTYGWGEPLHVFRVIAAPISGVSLPPLLLDRVTNVVGRRAFRKQQTPCQDTGVTTTIRTR